MGIGNEMHRTPQMAQAATQHNNDEMMLLYSVHYCAQGTKKAPEPTNLPNHVVG